MKLFSSSLMLLSASALGSSSQDPADFDSYLSKFDLSFSSNATEYELRKQIFQDNLDRITQHNADQTKSWTLRVTQFAHMTQEEFEREVANGYNKAEARKSEILGERPAAPLDGHVDEVQLPRALDWRKKKNVVTPVKNQGGCGSCWAFSATETMESHLAINFKNLLVLSPQQLVDCAPNPKHCGGTGGCQGSTSPLGFAYAETAGVITDKNYPYTATTDTCQAKGKPVAATIGGYVALPTNNYTALINAIQIEPISISVAASDWSLYSGGVYENADCGATINHAVQLVGYGVDKGVKYWTVRNSWGDSWGEDGYIRVKRYSEKSKPCAMDKAPQDGYACEGETKALQVCGLCGILSDSSYVTGGKIN